MHFKDKTTASSATGNANTPTQLLPGTGWNIPGGSVDLHDVAELHADFSLVGNGTAQAVFALGGVQFSDIDCSASRTVVNLKVWRTGSTQGVATGTVNMVGGGFYGITPVALNGLSWNGGQLLTVTGTATQQGGCVLQRAGLAR